MYGSLKSLVWPNAVFHKIFALAFTCGVAGLIGFGAFAIGSAVGDGIAVGIAFASVASFSLFPLMLSLLSFPDKGIRATGDEAPSLQKVFSGLF